LIKHITIAAAVVSLLTQSGVHAEIFPSEHNVGAAVESGARLPSNSIIDIVPGQGSLWLGTGQGIGQLHLADSGWTNINQTDGLGQGGVSALVVTDSIIWAATAYNEKVRDTYYPAGGGVGYSRDEGASWTWMPQPVDPRDVTAYKPTTTNIQNVTYDIALTDSAAWIVSWGGGLRRFKYGGNTWDLFTVDQLPFSALEHLAHRCFSAAWDGRSLWIGTAAGIYRTENEGQSWSAFTHAPGVANSLSGNFVTAMAVQKLPGRNILWAATWRAERTSEYYGVSMTEDAGQNWRVVLSDSTLVEGGEYLIDVYGPLRTHNFGFSDSVVYVCADEALWQSNDFGSTWNIRASDQLPIVDRSTGEQFLSPDFFSSAAIGDSLWVGTDDGLAAGWYDRIESRFKWVIHRAFASPNSDGEPETYAYPNPFSPVRGHITRLQFPISGPSDVSFEIRNYAMEPVYKSGGQTLPGAGVGDMAGYGAVHWNGRTTAGESVANGVYFYKVKVSGKEYWGKVMVID
jgi:hypothetical protein